MRTYENNSYTVSLSATFYLYKTISRFLALWVPNWVPKYFTAVRDFDVKSLAPLDVE